MTNEPTSDDEPARCLTLEVVGPEGATAQIRFILMTQDAYLKMRHLDMSPPPPNDAEPGEALRF